MTRYKLFMVIGCLLFLFGCGVNSKNPKNHADIAKDDYQKIVNSNNEFGFNLLKEVRENDVENVFISPASVFMALSMVYNGADGKTKAEIGKVLGKEEIEVGTLNRANASLTSQLQRDNKGVQLNLANSLWLNDQYHFTDRFVSNLEKYYQAKSEEIDINDRHSVDLINNWVEKSTNDKISDIVEAPLDHDLVLILLNAVYFKGEWTHQFNKEETSEDDFHLADGSSKKTPFMVLREELDYIENEYFQAVRLPYGEDEQMSMDIFLPNDDVPRNAFLELLTNEHYEEWKSNFGKKQGTLILPKFQIEYEVELNESLKNLGMVSAFSNEAKFPNMVKEDIPLWIDRVRHKTFIDINEEGTEAAAVTSVEMVTEMAMKDPPFYMEVNRPFFFTITDNQTETILFMGMIENPKK